MRNFRNAALAAATATAVAFGGVSVASAATGSSSQNSGTTQSSSTSKDWQANEWWHATDSEGHTKNPDAVPAWASAWRTGSIVAGVGSVIGLIIAAVNYASYNGWIQLPQIGR